MSDVSITAANVAYVSGNQDKTGNAGEDVTAGQIVYKNSTTSKWMKAQADGTAEESGVGVDVGVALHASANGQPLAVLKTGVITIGGTLVVGKVYVISATAGGLAPITDLVTGNRETFVGHAVTTGNLDLGIKTATGLQIP